VPLVQHYFIATFDMLECTVQLFPSFDLIVRKLNKVYKINITVLFMIFPPIMNRNATNLTIMFMQKTGFKVVG